ncbi:MAG: ribosomal-processing cysteine protease Prp [Desulfitobacteriaceae bacterium]
MRPSRLKGEDIRLAGLSRQPKGIRFVVWLDEREWIRQFQLSGHAGFAEYGQDIICAAVSALSIAAANGLENFLSIPPRVQEEEGFLTCSLEGVNTEELTQAQWILVTLRLGIEGIQEAYGEEYVKIERRRWTPC